MTNVCTTRRSEQGFTLVELAIVMVIIGLLIGGILKGQELIGNARISSTVSQLKGLDAALNTFQDKYNALPGDMRNTDQRLPNCSAAPCSSGGNGNGRFDNTAGAAPASNQEGVTAFAHLSAADLISGIDASQGSDVTFGGILPSVKVGGGMWLGWSSSSGAGTGITGLMSNRPYAALNGQVAAVSTTTGSMTPTIAAQIDRKLDDGVANTGGTQSICGSGGISSGAYQEANTDVSCAMYYRVLN